MDSHYAFGPVYAPTQPPDNRQPFNPLSTSQSYGTTFTTTLPPLSHNYHPFSPEHSAQGAASSQPAYTPTTTTADGQHTSYHSYARQDSLQASNYQQTPRSFQSAQPYQSLGTSSPGYRPYFPVVSQQSRLAEIRPMPLGGPNGHHSTSTAPILSTHSTFGHLATTDNAQPVHVVGSQGRRGILPSANGRPIAVASTHTSKSSTAGLKKDPSDGKWPCDHCNKRYLHAKHLKRHLLRHTGTRPYSCGLCKDTFSRSDILKRHFAKCSLRRGNPTGANHLTHSRATRKLRNGPSESLQQLNTSALPNQIADTAEFSVATFHNNPELNNLDVGQSSFSDAQQPSSSQLSRANSIKGINKSTPASTRGIYTAPNSAGFDSTGFPYSGGQATPDSLTTSGAATPFNYPNDQRSNQLSPNTTLNQSMNGLDLSTISRSLSGPSYSAGTLPHIVEHSHDRSNGIDWPLHHAEEHDEYSTGHYHNNNPQPHIKSEMNYSNGSFPLAQHYPPFHAATQ